MLKKVNSKLFLDDYEMSVLDRYNIDYKNAKSIDEVILLVQMNLNSLDYDDEEYDEIDDILDRLSERKYYFYTQK